MLEIAQATGLVFVSHQVMLAVSRKQKVLKIISSHLLALKMQHGRTILKLHYSMRVKKYTKEK